MAHTDPQLQRLQHAAYRRGASRADLRALQDYVDRVDDPVNRQAFTGDVKPVDPVRGAESVGYADAPVVVESPRRNLSRMVLNGVGAIVVIAAALVGGWLIGAAQPEPESLSVFTRAPSPQDHAPDWLLAWGDTGAIEWRYLGEGDNGRAMWGALFAQFDGPRYDGSTGGSGLSVCMGQAVPEGGGSEGEYGLACVSYEVFLKSGVAYSNYRWGPLGGLESIS